MSQNNNWMKRIFALLFLSVSLITNLLAGDAERIFAEGNKAYQAKEFSKAVDLYEQLLASGWRSADLEYNLGNAWHRLDSPGRAILHYERALLLSPGHVEATKNLAFLRSKIKDKLEPLPPFFLSEWWKSARMALSSTGMGSLALVLWWLGFGALVLLAFGKSRQQKKWGLLVGCGLLMLSLLPFSLALSRAGFEKNTRQAILIQKSAIIRTAPEDASQEVQTVQEGTKLEQVERLNGWWQVRLANGTSGWLPEQVMERI